MEKNYNLIVFFKKYKALIKRLLQKFWFDYIK